MADEWDEKKNENEITICFYTINMLIFYIENLFLAAVSSVKIDKKIGCLFNYDTWNAVFLFGNFCFCFLITDCVRLIKDIVNFYFIFVGFYWKY